MKNFHLQRTTPKLTFQSLGHLENPPLHVKIRAFPIHVSLPRSPRPRILSASRVFLLPSRATFTGRRTATSSCPTCSSSSRLPLADEKAVPKLTDQHHVFHPLLPHHAHRLAAAKCPKFARRGGRWLSSSADVYGDLAEWARLAHSHE